MVNCEIIYVKNEDATDKQPGREAIPLHLKDIYEASVKELSKDQHNYKVAALLVEYQDVF